MAFCAICGDQYDPVEYRPADPDGENFCSAECEDEFNEEDELTVLYIHSRYSGAPVF